MKRLNPELIPVLLAAFLAPLIGGHVSMDALPLTDSYYTALFGSPEAALGTRALLGTLLALGLGIALFRRQVIQIPSLPVGGILCGLIILTGLSVLGSSFIYASLTAWPIWIVFALATFSAVATSGRKAGVRALMWAIVLGTTLTALKGIREFSALRATDPGHRIFADWNNPNAVAGIFCVVAPLALALCLSSERLESLAAGLSGALILFALALTQSKGGLLACGLSVVVFIGAALVWKSKSRIVRVAVPVSLAVALIVASAAANRTPGGQPFGRVLNASSTQEQSAGYRSLLWKTSLELIKEKPSGYGVGTFRYESGRPGLTEQTFHAHQTWLQLAVEASPLATLLLASLAVLWVIHLMSGAKVWPWPEAGLRAGLLASCVAAAAHGLVESNLVYLGIGIVVFLVIGAGLQLSSDGVIPEYTPKKVRSGLIALACVVPMVILWHCAMVEKDKSQALALAQSGDIVGAKQSLDAALNLVAIDGEALYLRSRLETSEEERTKMLGQAASNTPSTKYLRAYARAAAGLGRTADVDKALERALRIDPNNLQTQEQNYLWLVTQGRMPEAVQAARRLVDSENLTVFKIRAIPELVPLETYDARVFLSGQTKEAAEKVTLLRPALEGYVRYMEVTKPMVERLTSADPSGSFLGHDRQEIEKVRASGAEVVKELRALYSTSSDSASLAWLDKVAPVFAG